MDEPDAAIGEAWREHHSFLVDLAFKMLGNFSDAEDVVQEAFSRLLKVDIDSIEDVRGWLIVVVSRICLDDLRSARSRRQRLDPDPEEHAAAQTPDPADRITLDDSIRMALVVVLQKLSPAERAVFVLHDVFQFSFNTIASIVGRTPDACRKLASRARQHIEAGTQPARFVVPPADQQRVVEQFIAATAGGDIDALVELLDPDVGGDVDLGGDFHLAQRGLDRVVRNALRFFGPDSGVTMVSHPVNGQPGMLGFQNHELYAIVVFEMLDGRIRDIHAMADPQKLALASVQFRPNR